MSSIAVLAVVSIIGAYLVMTLGLHRQRQLGPRVVKDSVPDGLRGRSPSLSERRERARERGIGPSGGVRDVAREAASSGDPVNEIEFNTEFRWQTGTDVCFEDVGGMDYLKQELREDILLPLKEHSEKADELGVSAANIILHGPPGTGKTHLAKALATELELPFVQLSGSDVQSKWINESAERVSALFEEAKEVADVTGGAVVFLDELDSVLKDRTRSRNAHEEDVKVVNEFLGHLEETDKHDIVFIGATNRVESLDEAGVRSGRIDKKIRVGMPDVAAREGIMRAQLSDRPHAVSDECVRRVAAETEGCSAADVSGVVECAAREALVAGRGEIKGEDLQRCC